MQDSTPYPPIFKTCANGDQCVNPSRPHLRASDFYTPDSIEDLVFGNDICIMCHKQTTREWIADRKRINAKRNLEKDRLWRASNKEQWRKLNRSAQHRRRAKMKGSEGSHTAQQIDALYKQQRERCWWCGKKLNNVYHVDHRIPISKNGSNDISNIVLACPNCNSRKHDKLPHEWIGRLL